MMTLDEAEKIAKSTATPLYIYDKVSIIKKINLFKEAFLGFNLLYSAKANPYEKIIETMKEEGVGIDAASKNEVLLSKSIGIDKIYYSSPGKTKEDILSTINKCTLIADSIGEIHKINKYADKKTKIGVRINVTNELIQTSKYEIMGGDKSKFGISLITLMENLNAIKALENVEISGIHVYFGSQILDDNMIINNFDIIAKTALMFKDIEFINFGGGFGVPYNELEVALDLKTLYKGIISSENVCKVLESDIQCNVELGRFLCAQCGIYITEVVDIKESFNVKYAIVKGGMNSFFRPIFTKQIHKVVQFKKRDVQEEVIIAGSMCTPIDEYGTFLLHSLKEGDLIGFLNGGAYGYTMSLLDFISHEKPVIYWKE